LEVFPATNRSCAEVGGCDVEAAQAVAVVPGDDGGGGEVDGLELPAPEALHGGCESLEAFEQEVALEGEMAHFIAQELFGDGLDDGIAAAQGEQAEIDFGDEFGGEKHLNVELEVH